MNCQTCQLLMDDYLNNSLGIDRKTAIDTHLATCPECRQELEVLRKLESVLSARPLKMPPANFTRRALAHVRRHPEPVKNNAWIAQILGYTASLSALAFGLKTWFDRDLWTFLSGNLAHTLAWVKLPETTPASAIDITGTLRTLTTLSEDWQLSLPTLQIPGLLEVNAVAILLALTWALYVSFSE